MSYDRNLATPSDEAHEAAESLDAVFEALSDGIDVSDVAVLRELPNLAGYLFESGVSKGELISRGLQVLSMVERDNRLLAGAVNGSSNDES